jgi:Tol biopolymer transport system component
LTRGAERDTPGSWSLDSRLVSFVRTKNESSSSSIWIVSGENEVVTWSGRRILVTSYRDGNPEVYVVNTDGTPLRRLMRKAGNDYAADFSPDGRKILFSSERRGYLHVYMMNLDGSDVRNLSRSHSSDWATSWQPLR